MVFPSIENVASSTLVDFTRLGKWYLKVYVEPDKNISALERLSILYLNKSWSTIAAERLNLFFLKL